MSSLSLDTLNTTLSTSLVCTKIKALLHQKSIRQETLFWEKTSVDKLLVDRSGWIDEILRFALKRFSLENKAIVLIAVGGYGRGYLHPYSDVDILILLKSDNLYTPDIEKLIAFCWDCGIKLGASTHTQDSCIKQASEDLTFFTALLSARLIAGEQQLYDAFMLAFKNQDIWPFNEFFSEKCAQRQRRYERYNQTEYALEPNIKESPGALRCLDLFTWFCAKKYHSHDLKVLVEHQDITQEDYHEILAAQQSLWEIRFALHLLSPTPTERLYFEHQASIAKRLFPHSNSLNDAISLFMNKYYTTASTVREHASLMCQHFEESLETASSDSQPLTPFCSIKDRRLDVTQPQSLAQGATILHLFYLLAKHHLKGFTVNTIKLIKKRLLTLAASDFNQVAHNTFLSLLALDSAVASTLTLMHRLSVLSHYIPAFSKITGQMQYDMFHLYTVDAHTLLLITTLETIFQQEKFEKFPLAKDCKALTKKHLLYLGALFHDIGKGQGGNHSDIGSGIANAFCQRASLSSDETALITWLVENHLLMSLVAQTKDISNERVIQDFVTLVNSKEKLCYLYLFTVADMIATNPSLWNDWRSSLLHELYLSSLVCLSNKPASLPNKAELHQQDALSILQQFSNFSDKSTVTSLWQHFDEAYFSLESSANIAWHTEQILSNQGNKVTIALREHHHSQALNIFIYALNKPTLFATVCACLEKCLLNIVQARIHHMHNDYISLSFFALDIDGNLHEQKVQHIHQTLAKALNVGAQEAYQMPAYSKHIGRRYAKGLVHITFSCENDKTVLKVQSADFPGLLARLGMVFIQLGVSVHSAIINTLGGQAQDTFYLSEKTTGKALSENTQQLLQEAIHKVIGTYSSP